jgi:hypothetical protein
MDKRLIERVALVVGGFAVGSGVTYLVTKKRLEAFYEERSDEEIAKTKAFLNGTAKAPTVEDYIGGYDSALDRMGYKGGAEDDDVAATIARGKERVEQFLDAGVISESELADAAAEELERRKGNDIDADDEDLVPATPEEIAASNFEDGIQVELTPEQTEFNVFDESQQSELANEEVPLPTPSLTEPYLIAREQFFEDEMSHFGKISLTYYEEDDTLTDEQGMPIDDPVSLLGDDFAELFGQHSGNDDLAYFRHPLQETDYEVDRDIRSYQEVHLNIKPERPTPRKMRGSDD